MTHEEHRQRHLELHKALDELLADFITHTGRSLRKTNLLEFMSWSHEQTQDPTPDVNTDP